MSLLDRILNKQTSVTTNLTVEPKEPEPPKNFCTQCGEAMVDGYMVLSTGYDGTYGYPVKRVVRSRLCTTQNGQPLPRAEDAGIYHDGIPYYSVWGGWGKRTEIIPDCDRPKKKGGPA